MSIEHGSRSLPSSLAEDANLYLDLAIGTFESANGEMEHMYQCDTYNEMRPRSNDPAYLAASAKAVSMSMRTADPKAIWLMQDWAFSDRSFWNQGALNSYMGAIPQEKLFLLMVSGEWFSAPERNYFEGHPYIWDQLLTFGGQQHMGAPIEDVACRLGQALHNPLPHKPNVTCTTTAAGCVASGLQGVGLTWEGIWIDYIMADYVLSSNWVDTATGEHRAGGLADNDTCATTCNPNGGQPSTPACEGELTAWIKNFGRRRYGYEGSESGLAVWADLATAAYLTGADGAVKTGVCEFTRACSTVSIMLTYSGLV